MSLHQERELGVAVKNEVASLTVLRKQSIYRDMCQKEAKDDVKAKCIGKLPGRIEPTLGSRQSASSITSYRR